MPQSQQRSSLLARGASLLAVALMVGAFVAFRNPFQQSSGLEIMEKVPPRLSIREEESLSSEEF